MAEAPGNPPKIFHIPTFRSTRPVWLFHELQEAYRGDPRLPRLEVVYLDPSTFRTQKSEALLRVNPNGKVPALVHGNICMFESMAILQYFLDQWDFDHILAPVDPQFRAKFYQFCFYMAGTVDNLTAVSSPIQGVLSNPRPGDDNDLIALNQRAFVTISGPILSAELGDRSFFFGETFTALDVVVGYFLIRCPEKEVDFLENFPNLQSYAIRLKQREAYKKSVAKP